MKKTLRELAQIVGGEVSGDSEVLITGASGIKEAKEGEITFVANPKYTSLMSRTRASAIIVAYDVDGAGKPLLRAEDPSLAFAKIVNLLAPNQTVHPSGIDKRAVIGKNVKLGKDVAVQAYAVIEDSVEIGDRSVIYAGVYIGHHTKIGEDTIICANVSIGERLSIGNRVVIHSGSVIGSGGFGFATVKGVHHRIPQIGTVVIEDDVDIGSNVTIDRARFDKTIIGKGTKIDNLVQIAHNVTIGENCIIVAQTGISGSTVLGKNVITAGQSGLVGHIMIGDNARIAAQAGVTRSVPPNTVVSGYPAREHQKAKRVNACVQQLPKLYRRIKQLEEEIERIKSHGAPENH